MKFTSKLYEDDYNIYDYFNNEYEVNIPLNPFWFLVAIFINTDMVLLVISIGIIFHSIFNNLYIIFIVLPFLFYSLRELTIYIKITNDKLYIKKWFHNFECYWYEIEKYDSTLFWSRGTEPNTWLITKNDKILVSSLIMECTNFDKDKILEKAKKNKKLFKQKFIKKSYI